MKKLTYVFSAIILAVILQAKGETLKVDFNGSTSNGGATVVQTQGGYEAYNASNELASSFGSRTYSVFNTTVTVTPAWASGAVAAAQQAWNRGNSYGYSTAAEDMLDLVVDWIGTDQRQVGDPMTLTVSGLPAGTYTWRSYHHDTQNQTGHFSVTVNDAAGSATTTGLRVSSSQSLSDLTLADVTKFDTQIIADGVNPVALVFEAADTPDYYTMFVMNGFELTRQLSGDGRAQSPIPANGAQLGLDGVISLSWQGSTDQNIVSIDQYDLVFGTNSDMHLNTTYHNVTSPFNLAANGIVLDYNTTYYWRIDSHVTWDSKDVTGNIQEIVEGNTWSFGTSAGLRRPISPKQPMWLIHIDTWNWPDPQKIIDLIPTDIRPYVVFNISLSISHEGAVDGGCIFNIVEYGCETAKSWVRTCAENRVWCMVQPSSGGYSHLSDYDLSVYEEFFRDYPNFLGFNYAEQFWGFDGDCSGPWIDRANHWANLMGLAHKYGGYVCVSFTGGYWGANLDSIAMVKRVPALEAICKQHPENFIMCEKYTMGYGFHDIESTCLGMFVSGYAGHYGIRFDQCGWNNNGEDFPVAAGAAPVIEHVMLTGETVIDGPELIWQQCTRGLSNGTTSDGYTTRRWGTFSQFDNISIDIFRKVLDGTIRLMTREEVIDRTKVVIVNNVNSGDDRTVYSSPETLFSGLYLMDGDGTYLSQINWFKKTGRYPSIPTVAKLADSLANSFQVKVNRSDYSTRWPNISSKATELNSIFPEEYTGDIYAGRYKNGWVIYNPYRTGDIASGSIPFKYNTCDSVDLAFSQYTACVMKEYANKVTFYLTNYDNIDTSLKTDMIEIYGSTSEPTYSWYDRASHQASIVTKRWSGGVFTLTVQHNGPLDITVNCAGSAAGRLTSYQTAAITAPFKPLIYTGPRQYEAENFDYKNIAVNVTNGVNQGIANYTGQGYMRFGTNSAARIRDYVTVLKTGAYRLETKYAVTGANISSIDLYVNGTKAAAPTFTQTATLSDWAVNKQNITLNAGTNTIEFRANAAGASSIYFDNIVIVPTVYGDGFVIQENEVSFQGVDGIIDNTYSGYTGNGYANTNDTSGAGIDWYVYLDSSITKSFTFRYACPDDRTANLIVDGTVVVSNIQFHSTGGWDTWDFVTVYTSTKTGISNVRLQSTSAAGLPNIDYMEFIGGGVATLPLVPTGLNAEVVSSSQIDLTWDASFGASTYHVKRSIDDGGPYTTIVSVEGTNYNDTGLQEKTMYYYVVSAVNSIGESTDSAQVGAATLAVPPAAPSGLTAMVGDGSVALNWNANAESDLAGYNVYRSTTSGGGYTLQNSSLLNSPEFTDNSVTNFTVYYYVVTAVDIDTLESVYSDEIEAIPNDGSFVQLSKTDFESGFGDWTNITGDDTNDWTLDSGGTTTPNTGPATGANDSTWYVYLETSPGGANTAGNTAILQSPRIRGFKRVLRFYYHMYGSQIGTLNVDVYDGTWHNAVWTLSGQQQTSNSDPYIQATVDLNGFVGPIQIRFRAVAAGGTFGDMAIDNIEVLGRILYGDMNGDNIVDISDLPEFAGCWLQEDCDMDLNGDCLITMVEFTEFADNWLDGSYQ
jgi:hypothetical protein